jgi:hypothetical protein
MRVYLWKVEETGYVSFGLKGATHVQRKTHSSTVGWRLPTYRRFFKSSRGGEDLGTEVDVDGSD